MGDGVKRESGQTEELGSNEIVREGLSAGGGPF